MEALQTISKVLGNIASHPHEPKYRTLRLSNQVVQKSVGRHPDAVQLLQDAGFTLDPSALTLTFAKERVSQHLLSAVSAGLEEAKAIREAIDMSMGGGAPHHHDPSPAATAQQHGAVWLPWRGSAGSDSFPAGRESDGRSLFLAKGPNGEAGKCGAHLGDAIHTVDASNTECSRKGHYLSFDAASVSWVPGKGRPASIPPGAVEVGVWKGGPAYAARGSHGGGTHPGFVGAHFDGCITPYGGCGTVCWNYDILTAPAGVRQATPVEVAALQAPRCCPLNDAEELFRFDPQEVHPALRAPRLPPQGGVFKYARTKGPRMLLCHDMQGNYTAADVSPFGPPRGDDSLFRVRHWDAVDVFVYFSHSFVTVPPVGWTVACHRHGARCLGTLIVEGESGARSFSQMLAGPDAISKAVRQLVAVQRAYGFDGWFVNIEVNLPQQAVAAVCGFLGELTQACHAADPLSLVINYDSVVHNGQLRFQNKLNDANSMFFASCDGIFTNYWWTENCPESSKRQAGQRARDVYHGIDVHGRRTFGGGGLTTHTAVEVIGRAGVSCAVFAPAWTWEGNQGNREKFEEVDDTLWSRVKTHTGAAAVVSGLPFHTTFDVGCGAAMHLYGEVDEGKWFNLGSASPFPVLPLKAKGAGVVTSSVCTTDAYDGGSSLEVAVTGATMSIIPLFDTAFATPDVLTLEIAVKGAKLGLLLSVVEADGTSRNYVLHPAVKVPPSNTKMKNVACRDVADGSWTRRSWTLEGVDGVTINSISAVVLAKDAAATTKAVLGMLAVSEGQFNESSSLPLEGHLAVTGSLVSVSVDRFDTAGLGGLAVSHADIFHNDKWLGRTHTGVFVTKIDGPCHEVRVYARDTAGRPMLPISLRIN
eukprot:TRINITY_DN44486_c0_g1_i1.p1 TRINITY_DN44486_c0_g1~~TRINITY_DN44486_c0_g1_i1.p1  ORF type:complete len:895 (+),score=338.30 TRINITY_DN44486_c0_g1_i1:73-2685(+)